MNAQSYLCVGACLLSVTTLTVAGCESDDPYLDENPAPAAEQLATSIVLVPAGATWRYRDDGSDQGTAWRSKTFDDTKWKSGAAQLGYGDGDERTIVSYGSSSSRKYITTYFRKTFSVSDPRIVTELSFRLIRDDGAVVYLNGVEVWRSNLPSGTINAATLATNAGSTENVWQTLSIVGPASLVAGANVVAVEIHQVNASNPDISFDLDLRATVNESLAANDAGSDATVDVASDGGSFAATAPFFDTADWLWKPIPPNPTLDPSSTTWASYLGAAGASKILNTYAFGSPTYFTNDAQGNRRPGAAKTITVTHSDWGPNPFGNYNPIWVPDDAAPSPGSDAAMVIVDPTRNLTFEFWQAKRDANGVWSAGWGNVLCYHGQANKNAGGCDTNQHGGVGAGISRLAGLVTRADIAAGAIRHALVFSTDIAQPVAVRYPATKTDGSNVAGVATPIPEGARIQLDPSADISSLTGYQRMIAETLKQYGAYVIDNGGARVAIIAEGQDPAGPKSGVPFFSSTTPVPGNPVSNGLVFYGAGMRDTGGGYQSLSSIPWNRVRVLRSWNGM